MTQLKSLNNLVDHVGVELGEAIRMCSVYPAKVMQQKEIVGSIEIGGKADLLCLSADRHIIKMILA